MAGSQRELRREFRLAAQTVAMHDALKDRFSARARAAEIVLLLASVLFCAATFAPDSLLSGVESPLGLFRLA